jgi:Flp pilus assembly pilin Flp
MTQFTLQDRRRRLRRDDGQVLAEYAVILGVITLAVVATFVGLAGGISSAMNTVVSAF